jgi:outer membrane immunogenic protein
MRLIGLAATLSLALAGSAHATDWTGGYLGVAMGYADASDAWDEGGAPGDPALSPEGGNFSVYAGYGVDLAGLVLGLEGDLSFPDLNDNATCDVLFECTFDVELMTSLRGRAGVALGPILLYGTAGIALGYIATDTNELGGFSASKTLSGYTVGVGSEIQLADSLRLGIEYRHSDYGNTDVDLGTPSGDVSLETDEVRLRLGLVF